MFTNIKGNLFGGITAGIVAMPLALAFGEQSGLGAHAGLMGALMIGFFAAVFGGTPTQISGPTAPMTSLAIVLIGLLSAYEGGLILTLFTFTIAGLIQIAMGFLGIGKYVKYIPYPASFWIYDSYWRFNYFRTSLSNGRFGFSSRSCKSN